MTRRSYLFVPGDRPERFRKALDSGAHAVIIDLEDAVLPERKCDARSGVREWLARASDPVLLRVNAAGTPWHDEDRELLALPAVQGVMVPKSESPELLEDLADGLRGHQVLIPLVETVAGHFAALEIARVTKVDRIAFGSIDFMADAGIRGDAEELDAVRTNLVLVSRRAGIAAPLDGITLATDDAVRLESDVQRSRRFGMGGKLCIHPKQVMTVNVGFAPTPDEIAWAQRVIDALSQPTRGAVTVDGKMVDRPVAMLARTLLEEAASREVHPAEVARKSDI